MNAAAISRKLRSLGFRPVAPGTLREGLKVTNSYGGRVRVTADLDSPRASTEMAQDALQALADAGYEVVPTAQGSEIAAFYVTGRS